MIIDRKGMQKIESLSGFSSLEIMETVSRLIADKIMHAFSRQDSIVVLAGKGNNGGDGYTICKYLKDCTFKILPIDGKPVSNEAIYASKQIDSKYIYSYKQEYIDQLKTGDTISGYSWTSGNTVTATIDNIDTVPASGNNYYNGSGNPNVSYYGFEAYVEDSASLQLGEYLELTLNTDAADTTNSIWLSKAYVRQDGNKYYVFKDDHGKLKKQYVTIGKIVWGDTIEIKDGLSDTDYIAFAYSKNAKEGIKTKNSSQEAL